jgi:hypothetical protein
MAGGLRRWRGGGRGEGGGQARGGGGGLVQQRAHGWRAQAEGGRPRGPRQPGGRALTDGGAREQLAPGRRGRRREPRRGVAGGRLERRDLRRDGGEQLGVAPAALGPLCRQRARGWRHRAALRGERGCGGEVGVGHEGARLRARRAEALHDARLQRGVGTRAGAGKVRWRGRGGAGRGGAGRAQGRGARPGSGGAGARRGGRRRGVGGFAGARARRERAPRAARAGGARGGGNIGANPGRSGPRRAPPGAAPGPTAHIEVHLLLPHVLGRPAAPDGAPVARLDALQAPARAAAAEAVAVAPARAGGRGR